MEEFKMFRATESHLPLVQQLFLEARGIRYSLEFLNKKYGCMPEPFRFLCYLATDSHENPVGFLAIVVRELQGNSEIHLSGELVDGVTSPNHRGKGIFVALAQKLLDACKTLGLEVLFGTPNHLSGPILEKKLGWEPAFYLNAFLFQPKGVDWYRYCTRFAVLRRLYFKYLDRKMRPWELKGLFPRSQENGNVGIKPTKEFFLSKKVYENKFIAFEGFAWWFRLDGGLFLGDVQPLAPEMGPKAFAVALPKLLKRLGIVRAFGQFHPQSFASKCFCSLTEPNLGTPVHMYYWNPALRQITFEFSLCDADDF